MSVSDPAPIAEVSKLNEPPLVFISHDSRDAELAEAFARLLRTASSGMLKSFFSSDKKGRQGIEFGDEWYKIVMEKLALASDVVCLLTDRSLERPWLLYEAGVAKGKKNTPVHGVALGIPLIQASTGPFYQFQNSDDSPESLIKLVQQLCKRVPGMEPDEAVVASQVHAFKSQIQNKLPSKPPAAEQVHSITNIVTSPDAQEFTNAATSIAKLLEELKIVVREIPMRIDRSLHKAKAENEVRLTNHSPATQRRLLKEQQMARRVVLRARLIDLAKELESIDDELHAKALVIAEAVLSHQVSKISTMLYELRKALDFKLGTKTVKEDPELLSNLIKQRDIVAEWALNADSQVVQPDGTLEDYL
jgi:hypothetical protein